MLYYIFLQVDVIRKRENSLGYIGGQVNSLTGLSSPIFFRLIQVNFIVGDVITSSTENAGRHGFSNCSCMPGQTFYRNLSNRLC